MSKLELSLDEVIMSDKKKKQFREKAKQTVRGGSGRGGRATGGGGRTGGGGGRQQGGGQQQQERRQGGGVQRGQRRTRGQRATPYDKGNPENMWSHDLYNEDEERRRGGGVDRDLGNTGFLKRSLGGGGGGDKTTVEITNLSYDVSSDDLKRLLGGDGDLLKVHIAFDRSGRSEGTAKAVFESREAANRAVRDFDGAELEGQVLSLAIVANEASRGRRGGGAKTVGDGNFQLSTSGGRKVITRAFL